MKEVVAYVMKHTPSRHYIKPGSVLGTFKAFTQMSNFNCNEMNTSVTSDGTYLYVRRRCDIDAAE